MKLFFTRNCQHFAKQVDQQQLGKMIIKQFSDHELYVKIEENLFNEPVWLIASTLPPAESMLELFFILDALDRSKATINLVLVYCAYARQDRAEPGEALSIQVFFNGLKQFAIQKTAIIHMHSKRAHDFFEFTNIIPYDFFGSLADHVDTIAAPDKGAYDLAKMIVKQNKKELVLIEKRRPVHEEVEIIAIDGHIQGKKILIVDDMINTAGTICKVANYLKDHGAAEISVAATHGILAYPALDKIRMSPINNVAITNTIMHPSSINKIQQYDIWPLIASIIEQ